MTGEVTIKSTLPGTFYRRPDPQSPPYVSEGDTVRFREVSLDEAIEADRAVDESLTDATVEAA